MAYRTWYQGRQRGGSNIKTTMTAAEKTWLGSDGKAVVRQKQDGSDSDGSGANLDLWQKLRQDGRNGCDNTAAEQTWFGGSISNSNGIGETAATVEA